MKKILIITQHADRFTKLADGLTTPKTHEVIWADSLEAARTAASGLVDLIIIDENLDGRSCMSIAKDMISVNAMAHLALVSALSSDEFHEASEGLGVLGNLPSHPDKKDADRLLNALAAFF